MNTLLGKQLITDSENPVEQAQALKDYLYEKASDPQYRYVSVGLPFQNVDPLACLEMNWNDNYFQYYWENPKQEIAIAAGEALLELSASGSGRFEKIKQQLKRIQQATAEYNLLSHSYAGMLFLGGFSFFDSIKGKAWKAFKAASFTVPKWAFVRDGKCTFLIITADFNAYDSVASLYAHLLKRVQHFKQLMAPKAGRKRNKAQQTSSSFKSFRLPQADAEYSRWTQAVARAKDYISENVFQKIVLAREVIVPNRRRLSPSYILNILRQQYHSCYSFLLHRPGGNTFLGSTPERLASFRRNLLLTEALAGSIKRGNTAATDTYFEQQLTSSSKNLHEHSLVVEDIEQRLRPLAYELNSSKQPEVKKLSNVQHLYTSIRARLEEGVHPLAVVNALHPTPAVGGYPRMKATPYIKKLENFNRGWYAGPIGWLNKQGNGDFAVGIRSGLLTESKAHFFAGCGIVSDSNAAEEWDETHLKLKPMLSVLQYD